MGLGWTLATAFCAGVIALLIGSIIGIIRTTPNKWAGRLGNAYVELFRNIPLLVQLFLWFFVIAGSAAEVAGHVDQADDAAVGVVCSGGARAWLFTSARVAEQVRAGIQALPRGQRMAGTALGIDAAADLSLYAVADGLPHHPAAAHLGDDESDQEHVGGA